MRRVDRRLREVWLEAAMFAARVADEGQPDELLATDLACLRLKASAATDARDEIVARRRKSKQKATHAALTQRVDRHATESERLLLRLGRALALRVTTESDRSPDGISTHATERSFRRRTWIPVLGTAAALTLAAVALVVIESDRIREGLLAGGPDVSPISERTPVPRESQGGAPTVAASPLTIVHTFDDERIGFPDGWDRAAVGGSVSVVAFPTSFNRSLEVTTTDGELTASCLRLDTPVQLGAFEVDLLLPGPGRGTAGVTLGTPGSAELLSIVAGTDAISMTAADGSSVTAAGVAPEEWYRLRLKAQRAGYEITVENLAAGGYRSPIRIDTTSSVPVSQICLEIDGSSGAAAHYDNLALHSLSPLEG
jgi:hypothetical protein